MSHAAPLINDTFNPANMMNKQKNVTIKYGEDTKGRINPDIPDKRNVKAK
jgi:hypothetical protein